MSNAPALPPAAEHRSGEAATWALLGCGIASEVCASLSLRGTLVHPALYVVVALGYLASFGFLTAVLKRGLGLGVAYGIWGACGVVLTVGLAAVIFDERITPVMVIGVVVVVAGVLLVQFGRQAARALPEEP
jgi:small multidrug resistance pump